MRAGAAAFRAWGVVGAAVLLLSGCTFCSTGPYPAVTREHCPDFSGDYQYPGFAGLSTACSVRWEGLDDMPLPGSSGFVMSAREPHPFEVLQDGCQSLTLRAYVLTGSPKCFYCGTDVPQEIVVDLVPRRRGDQVSWTESSLFLRRRYQSLGPRFLPLWSFDFQELTLTRTAAGLRYNLKSKSGSGLGREKLIGEIDCVLPRLSPPPP